MGYFNEHRAHPADVASMIRRFERLGIHVERLVEICHNRPPARWTLADLLQLRGRLDAELEKR